MSLRRLLTRGFVAVISFAITCSTMAQQAPQRVAAMPGQSTQAPQGGQPGNAQPNRPAWPPFVLSPQQQAQLDGLLNAWQQQSAQIRTLSCNFQMWEYNQAFAIPVAAGQPAIANRQNFGAIHYAAPDRGYYSEDTMWEYVPGKPADAQGPAIPGKYEKAETPGMKWICDGRAIYEFKQPVRELIEHRLPKELQGAAISETPLPFLFGVDAGRMKQRYLMRINTPPSQKGEVWIEAFPLQRKDAANYTKVDLILSEKDLLPTALQMQLPDGSRNVYRFTDAKVNAVGDQLQNFVGLFTNTNTPFGWKRVVEEAPVEQGPPQAAVPGAQRR